MLNATSEANVGGNERILTGWPAWAIPGNGSRRRASSNLKPNRHPTCQCIERSRERSRVKCWQKPRLSVSDGIAGATRLQIWRGVKREAK